MICPASCRECLFKFLAKRKYHIAIQTSQQALVSKLDREEDHCPWVESTAVNNYPTEICLKI